MDGPTRYSTLKVSIDMSCEGLQFNVLGSRLPIAGKYIPESVFHQVDNIRATGDKEHLHSGVIYRNKAEGQVHVASNVD